MATLNYFSDDAQASKHERIVERMSVEVDDSNPQEPKLKLRQQSWAEGMGWFTQKTITLGLEEACDLVEQLEQTTRLAKMRRSQPLQPKTQPQPFANKSAKIITFPVEKVGQSNKRVVESGESKMLSLRPRK